VEMTRREFTKRLAVAALAGAADLTMMANNNAQTQSEEGSKNMTDATKPNILLTSSDMIPSPLPEMTSSAHRHLTGYVPWESDSTVPTRPALSVYRPDTLC
jgi:hypothetical protein